MYNVSLWDVRTYVCFLCAICLIFRDSVSQCGGCVEISGCGFCLSSLECIEGTDEGPLDGNGCPNWVTEPFTCPGILLLLFFIFKIFKNQKNNILI